MRPKVNCPVCKQKTDLSRGVNIYGNVNGVFMRVKCAICSAELVVKVLEPDNREVAEVVT